jgi:hypothetical protein
LAEGKERDREKKTSLKRLVGESGQSVVWTKEGFAHPEQNGAIECEDY